MTDTSHHQHDNEALDRIVDDAVREMTAVDRLEAPSRARLLGRLVSADAVRDAVPGWTVRRAAPWATAAAAASLAAVLLFLATVGEPRGDRPSAPSAASTEAVPRPLPAQPATAPARPVSRVAPADHASSAKTLTPVRSRDGSTGRSRTAPPVGEDRVAAFVRAVQQLPSDVWERQDAAGPPVVTELKPPADTSIDPIAISQLPASDWSEPQPDSPPGDLK